MKSKAAWALATWFGCGFSPFAPGTAGSLGALPFAFLLTHYAGWPPWYLAVLAAVLTPVSMWAADVVARESGREDPGLVVVDEVLGQWITLSAVPMLDFKTILIGFVLFRALDVWKPPPARQFEALHGGVGIVADDLMAGVYGAVILALIARYVF